MGRGRRCRSGVLAAVCFFVLWGCEAGGGADGADAGPGATDAAGLADSPDSSPGGTDGSGLADSPDSSPGGTDGSGLADGVQDGYGSGDVAADAPGGLTSCPGPAGVPTIGATCAVALSCDYGQECCCGECKVSMQCKCSAGGPFQCAYSDFCLGAWSKCSPGCDFGQFQTSQGCQACSVIQAQVQKGVSAAVAAHSACQQDADCTALVPSAICSLSCPLPAAVSQVQALMSDLTALDKAWCAWPPSYDPCGQGKGGCGASVPVCVAGACQLVSPCDPAVFPAGSTCDDGDSCTSGDACAQPGGCKGQPLDCDDGNPCTADTCQSGCQHAPIAGKCAPSKPCSLGGVCQAGQCVDGGVTGSLQTWPGPVTAVALAVDPTGTAWLAMTAGPQGQAQVRVLRVALDGKTLWDKTFAAVGQQVRAAAATATHALVLAQQATGPALSRLEADGTVAWTTPLPGVEAGALVATPDGAALAGVKGQELWVGTVDLAGKPAAGQVLGQTVGVGSVRLGGLQDGGLLVAAGVKGMIPQGELPDVRLLRLAPAGQKLWEQTFVTDDNDLAQSLVQWPSGDVGLVQAQVSYGKNDKSLGARVRRLKLDGNQTWTTVLTTLSPVAAFGSGEDLWVYGHLPTGSPGGLRWVRLDAAGQVVATGEVPASLLPGPVAGVGPTPTGPIAAGLMPNGQAPFRLHLGPCPGP